MCVVPDQDDPERLHHPRVSGQVDAAHKDGDAGAGRVVWPQSGEGRAARARRLLLREPVLQPLLQIQQERGQTQGGAHICMLQET